VPRLAPPAALALAIALGTAGCRPKPACNPTDAKGCVIEKVGIDQHSETSKDRVSDDDVEGAIATVESSFFVTKTTVALLGQKGEIFLRYEHFDRLVLERDLDRIERHYQARGFHSARVRAARVLRTSDSTVKVLIEVHEGPPTILTRVEQRPGDPAKPLPPDLALALIQARGKLARGARFEEEPYDAAKRRMVRALTDRGYAYAAVAGSVQVDRASHTAEVAFTVDTGPECTFGPISIEGHGDLPEEKLRAVLDIEPGERFSTDALERAQTALGDTGVLGAVTVEVVRSPQGTPPRDVVPIRFLVQKASLRAIVVGGGAELGSRVRAHVVSSWEHKNFFGGLRRLFIDAKAGVLLHPLQLVNWEPPSPGVRPLPEVRTTAELRQPGFLEERTTGSGRFQLKFFRPDTADATVVPNMLLYENLELHGTVALERPFWKSRVRLGASLNGQMVAPVPMYATPGSPALPAGFDFIYLPYLEATAALDLRRGKSGRPDPNNPHSGFYLAAAAQVAWVFPEAGWDVRIRPELRGYVPLGRDVTLALRAAGGFLFPSGYGQRLFDAPDASPCAADDAACNAERSRSLQIVQLRGLYSGGPDTNRGYARNGVNPQEEVLALFQSGTEAQLTAIGGRWLWEAQLELRFPIWGDFGGSVFVDSGDAWYGSFAFRPHLSAGIGLRYVTPIGPLRADAGVRIPCAQAIGTCEERDPLEGGPPRLAGLPINVSIALGNPF
jgi:hypothetical protein